MSDLARFRLEGLTVEGAEALPWRETAVEGVSWIPLAADSGASPRGETSRPGGCVLIRMAPGRGYPAHRHLGAEDVLILQGGYRDEEGEHRRGDFLRYPPGSAHSPVATGRPDAPIDEENPACILFSSIATGIELL